MKYLIVIVLICCSVGIAYAWDDNEYEIKSRTTDLFPGDGMFEAGTPSNPYVVEDSSGDEIGTVKTRTMDLFPGDGMFEAGTDSNPYVIKFGDN